MLKIITDNEFIPFFESDKIGLLIGKIWDGIATENCDGHTSDFSIVHFIWNSTLTKLPG
jgi:hypothetical protein